MAIDKFPCVHLPNLDGDYPDGVVIPNYLGATYYQTELRTMTISGVIGNVDRTNNYFLIHYQSIADGDMYFPCVIPSGNYTIEEVGDLVEAAIDDHLQAIGYQRFVTITYTPATAKFVMHLESAVTTADQHIWFVIDKEYARTSPLLMSMLGIPYKDTVYEIMRGTGAPSIPPNKAGVFIGSDLVVIQCDELCQEEQVNFPELRGVIGYFPISFTSDIQQYNIDQGTRFVFSYMGGRLPVDGLEFKLTRFNLVYGIHGPLFFKDGGVIMSFRVTN